ncbi:allantoate amidohydrolase [Nonomuraea sp. NPDC049269]|uniref:allantoate amidohydrolase n=1 Tax=Nonomuraea sp. NPDC049269 TaxID=3364349 RepID=UPI00371B4959
MWRELLPVGRYDATGGYRRHAWNAADGECRAWFREQALKRGLTYEVDRNGNQWAWFGDPSAGDAIVTGSHLDSVPDGGAYDGPLGVVSAFAALDALRDRGTAGGGRRPLAIVNFGDEEGARFGVACVGSRLMAGVLEPGHARSLRDQDGVLLGDAMERAGHDPAAIGRDDERLARIGAYVELHVEQGRNLGDAPVGVASAIWPHGRWRFDFHGEANHAGTTRLEDRRDPMLAYAATVLNAREQARLAGALATFGKISVEPNGTNAIASRVTAWLDSRAADSATLDMLVKEIIHQSGAEVTRESFTPVVEFDRSLRDRLAARLGGVPVLPTGAGHDAGILASAVPTAMLFVRNPTGVSHSPAEHAEETDCLAGVAALASVLEDLL